MSALRAGAELSHVFCVQEAAIPIKSYSPEIMVHAIDDKKPLDTQLNLMFQIANSVVVGPGLGREETSEKIVETVVKSVHEKLAESIGRKVNLVLDADSLWFLKENEGLRTKLKEIAMRQTVILTPNLIEFKRLWESAQASKMTNSNHASPLPTAEEELAFFK